MESDLLLEALELTGVGVQGGRGGREGEGEGKERGRGKSNHIDMCGGRGGEKRVLKECKAEVCRRGEGEKEGWKGYIAW